MLQELVASPDLSEPNDAFLALADGRVDGGR